MEDDVMTEIKAIIEESEEGVSSSRTCCIYRVPHVIRELKPEAYTPKAVSIGPFHYGNQRLQNMERHKHIFFKRFTQHAITSLDDLVSFAKHSEPRVRASYSEYITLSKKELVKMILVDAGFLIELFIYKFYNDPWFVGDSEVSKPVSMDIIHSDLLLLENQLPFFFLEELFGKAFPPRHRGNVPSFLELTYNFFAYHNTQELEPDDPNAVNTIKHFTDLVRFFHLQRQKPHRQRCSLKHAIQYSANELEEAGVKFKASKNKCLLDLKFSKGVFEVPEILVQDSTETLFRNMMALEQCHYPYESYITDYAITLDYLINTNKDVDVLIRRNILLNSLGDTNNVANLFNGLGKNILVGNVNSDYFHVWERLNGFYGNSWNKMKATLRRDYCSTPWQTAGSIAGIILLVLSLVQAIFSVLQVAK